MSQSSLATAIVKARRAGRELLDLTVSNPTRCGFDYDVTAILGPLDTDGNVQEALVYSPDPRGMRPAREAVVSYYAEHSAVVDCDSIVLTTSTSEAYSYIFRLLCDAGDEVLVPQPSYPLFEFLADLDDVKLQHYPLFYDHGWWIDFAELERRVTPRTRAILVVHPNNPTGHWTREKEREHLEALCERYGIALIVDEVFLDYPLNSPWSKPAHSFATAEHPTLTFILSGISKIAALPQMKVAWLIALGPPGAVAGALARLEMVADIFLSMNAPGQLALPAWLEGRRHVQRQIQTRIKSNFDVLRASGIEVAHLEAGWSAVLRLRGLSIDISATNGQVAEVLLQRFGVIVHPGDFYGLTGGRTVIVSMITPVETFRRGVEHIASGFDIFDRTGNVLET